MINHDLFNKKLKKASLLTGFGVEEEVAMALYEELKTEDEKDFLFALKDLAYSGDRITLANIQKYLARHKSNRIEKESLKQKKEEEKTVINLLKKEGIPQEIRVFFKKLKRL